MTKKEWDALEPELKEECAEIIRQVILGNHYVIEGHHEDFDLAQDTAIARSLNEKLKKSYVIKKAYNKFDWGK